ncbi:MAG TPA: hypothetical protein VGM03_19570 [Phycisphaerae bacterium]
MTTIQIDDVTAEALRVAAEARGLTLDAFLRIMAGTDAAPRSGAANGTAEEFEALLDEFFAEEPRRLPSLPSDFSRADVYAEHD